jgi:lipoprotein NlpD
MNRTFSNSRVCGPASRSITLALAAVVLTGCASRGTLAPVEQRVPTPVGPAGSVIAVPAGGSAGGAPAGAAAGAAPAAPTAAASQAAAGAPAAPAAAASVPESRPAADSAVPAGHYMVKAGDTLVRIGLDTGQNWRDIARWNNIENPNVLEVGQVLRVTPPAAEAGAATARPVAPAPRIESRPLEARPAPPAASAPSGPSTPSGSPPAASGAPASAAPGAPATPPANPRESDSDIAWSWPAAGPVTTPFDEARSKGLSIAGKAGDPVLAAADGRVVYAGSGLRGYGNLVIVKHNATYLTAYAHNQTLLVKEDQAVRRGQKIAEMGSSDSDRVQLHFEVRRQGKPVDPAKVLPAR